MISNLQSGTTIDEIADGIYRISTPVTAAPGGFSFNQFLIVDEQALLFHMGPRVMSPLVAEAISTVMPVARLRWLAFSHYENDESGGMNTLLRAAPKATPVCSTIGAMIGEGAFDRPPRGLAEGDTLPLGRRALRWLSTPHVPHGWDCGFFYDSLTGTLLCGDLFTQAGSDHPPITESDILEPSESMRKMMEYYSHAPDTRETIARLAEVEPRVLACMHGTSYRGDGGALLRELARRL